MKKNQLSVILCLICLFVGGNVLSKDSLPSPFVILPQPQSVVLLKGSGLELGRLQQIVMKGVFKRPVMGEILSQLTIGKSSGKGTLSLVLDKTMTSIPSEEGYRMTISGEGVEIISKTEKGLFYGCQSLEQLLEDARDYKKPVPYATITDYPALTYRAVQFDLKHHLDHMHYYYECIDKLARYKINAAVFEFEDKLRYQRQPLVGAPQSISIDEMAALTRYAKERHIEITPLVQGLGHATFILKHQEYAYLREIDWNRWAFCPLHEGTYQVLFDLYKDAIEATPGAKYLHIGGDEIGNIGLCPRCKPTADKDGMMSLNLYWLKRVCEFARENNRIPIFWDDMPLQHAGLLRSTDNEKETAAEADKVWMKGIPKLDSLLTDFPKNCIYMRWNYSMARQEGNIRALDWYKSRGLKAMIATSSGAGKLRSFIQLAEEKDINGTLCTAWDDDSPHTEKYWPGFIASAEYSWNPNGRSVEEYNTAWLQREFGIAVPDFKSFEDQLNEGSVNLFRQGSASDGENTLQSLVELGHWLPPMEGQEKKQVDYISKLIELPNNNSPGSWSLKYKDRLDRCQSQMNNYEALSTRLAEIGNSSKRNRYYWNLMSALFNLKMTTPRLLLALKQSDSIDKLQQKNGLENVKKAMDNFWQVWADVQAVYSQTRFVSYPANYVPDRYFHLASQREDLSWMIQSEEIYFDMITKWLQNQASK